MGKILGGFVSLGGNALYLHTNMSLTGGGAAEVYPGIASCALGVTQIMKGLGDLRGE